MHGLNGVQIGADRIDIVPRHARIVGKGHRRIEARAIAAATLPDRGIKLIVRPVADTGLLVRCDVGRYQLAKNGVSIDRPPLNG